MGANGHALSLCLGKYYVKKKILDEMPGNSEAFAWVKPVCAVIQKIAIGVSVN